MEAEPPLEEAAEDEIPKSEQEDRTIPKKGKTRSEEGYFFICLILLLTSFSAHPFMEETADSLYNDLGKRKALYDQRIIPFLEIRPNRYSKR